MINLISNTATEGGLTIRPELNRGGHTTGVKVSAEQLAAVNFTPDGFHGDPNYSIHPVRRNK
jgi:hypothetical protein